MHLRIEIFCADLDVTAEFYTRVLRFEIAADRRSESQPYISFVRGAVHIGAVPSWQPVDPRCRDLPAGTEIVLEVDDVMAERDAVVAERWPLLADLREQHWGLVDFRLLDPDGYYLRCTSRPAQAQQ